MGMTRDRGVMPANGDDSSKNRFRANSLFGRINSLLPKIEFPVAVELIPCSVAQGNQFEKLARC
jgi:hypothetical protein